MDTVEFLALESFSHKQPILFDYKWPFLGTVRGSWDQVSFSHPFYDISTFDSKIGYKAYQYSISYPGGGGGE